MDFTGPHHVPVVSARATRSRVASGEADLATKSLGRTTFLAQDDFLTRTQRQATERETMDRGRIAVDRYAREAAEQTEREVASRTREILAEEAAAMERRMRAGWDGRGGGAQRIRAQRIPAGKRIRCNCAPGRCPGPGICPGRRTEEPASVSVREVRDCECVACHRADARPAREVARARASREGNIASRAGREVHEQRRWLASHRATVERTLHSVSAHSAWLLQHREGAACHRAGARRRRSSTRARLEGVWIAAETAVNHALRIWSAAFPRDQPWSNQVR
jgi:hypothetical protein